MLRGQGNAGRRGGQNGDLIVEINIRPHPVFERRGYDIYCEVPISFTEAALGGEIRIPTLEGEEGFKIPEGTQPGTVFTLKGRGVQVIRTNRRGNLYFTVTVEVPRDLTKEQKELLRQFESGITGKNMGKKSSFADKLKKLFQ